jgi:hypothetical protein
MMLRCTFFPPSATTTSFDAARPAKNRRFVCRNVERMKRTPAWLFVAAAMVQLAGLGLCVWAMERHLSDADDATPRPALAPPPSAPPLVPTAAAEPPPGAELPSFVAQSAGAEILQGATGGRSVLFACYPDGKIRFVDVDGSCYEGQAENGRTRLREIGGMRAITVRLAVASDGRREATFTGGQHDDATIALEQSVARINV